MAVAIVVNFHAYRFHSAGNRRSNTEISINCRVKYAMYAVFCRIRSVILSDKFDLLLKRKEKFREHNLIIRLPGVL